MLRTRIQTQAGPSAVFLTTLAHYLLVSELAYFQDLLWFYYRTGLLSHGLGFHSYPISFQGTGDVGVSGCHGLHDTHSSPAGISCAEQQLPVAAE